MLKAIYAGTFDPPTLGHLDIIKRAAAVHDELVVTATKSPSKTPMFSLQERIGLLSEMTSELPNVTVEPFKGLLVDFANNNGAKVLVRGLRAASDFEYEFEMAMMNRSLAPELETVFFVASPEYMFISSTLIREIAHGGGDIEKFVSRDVRDAIIAKLSEPSF